MTETHIKKPVSSSASENGSRSWTAGKKEIQKRGVSKSSTFEEAWEYMQSFRPTEAEVREWMDGTHSHIVVNDPDSPPGGTAEWFRPGDKTGWDGLHREGGKPALVKFFGSADSPENLKVVIASFYENDRPRSDGRPSRINMTEEGVVRCVAFSGAGFGSRERVHRMDGPIRVTLQEGRYKASIRLAYAIQGEIVENVEIWRDET